MADIEPTPLSTFRIPATPLARATIWAQGIYGVIQGVLILALSDQRFSAPSFAVLRTVPGGYNTWGVLACLLGSTILVASATHWFALKALGLLGLAAWAMCFAVGILLAVMGNPAAATTGIPTYTLIAVSAAILVWVDERRAYRP